ncbi:exosome component 10 isoform X1 [Zootoca vivipara]|uniref:exosome component 10 isoform X1 n=1 Tax=Zootoca vivipara TaxID=8524 RepID=UPI00293BCFF9|nr:exosome component 10 isoform X1 [Zootoca vivipara]
MAAKERGGGSDNNAEPPGAESDAAADAVLPGFKDADSFVKHALGTVVSATKASGGLPQPGDEYDFYRSFPGFQTFCEMQGDRLLHCMSRVMQYHGCRSHLRDRSKVTELEDKFDLLVDANDAILERVGMLLDEAAGVNKNQQPILPSGLQPPKRIVSSWNRKQTGEANKRTRSETFRLLHAKNIVRPQLKFREKVDNSNTPFVPKLFVKPNALKPLPEVLSKSRRERKERPEDLDVPAALADFLYQQRTQQTEQDMFAHPYQYELVHFSPPAELLEKPQVQMFQPLEETPCHFISTLDELVELNEKLVGCKEFALDLEHHSYRSFLGLTCLMQISTRTEDFIIDTLELRSDLYILNETFTDPAVVKVLHGADSDVEWLQRDFGLYLVNVFDTHQAARLLNLGRHSLDHLLKIYCKVDANKQYQLADWRIRPLPEEMLHYARDDTHYLLYIYDRVREELWEKANGQPAQLQVVWQRSKDICLKKYAKPIFTEDSYLELYRKQKKHLNSQQLAAFRLLFAWRDKLGRQEDESTGYVLPNHMLLKIAEELPKEPQGIIACCNPVPPLVRQQINEMHLFIQQAREMPLLKSEIAVEVKKRGPLRNTEKPENHLFGPHDSSHVPQDEKPNHVDPAPELSREQTRLFSEAEEETERLDELPSLPCLLLRASIGIFNETEASEEEDESLTVTQRKARQIMESFENPFRMYLPADQNPAHISQLAKFDPSSKIYEISNRWKLLSQAQLQAGTKKEFAKKKIQQTAAHEVPKKENKGKAENAVSVRQLVAQEQAGCKRERVESDPGTETPRAEKKKPKASPQLEEPEATPKPFTPFDYSKSDLQVFAGSSRPKPSTQFDPSKQAGKKFPGAGKVQQPAGTKSMSYMAGKSNRGFRHNWPKR